MTLEEKLETLSQAALEDATTQSDALIEGYQKEMEKAIKTREEELKQKNISEYEYQYAKLEREKNKALSQDLLAAKMTVTQKTEEITSKLFDLVKQKLSDFKKTPEYENYLLILIKSATDFSNGKDLTIYLDSSDASLKETLEKKSGKTIELSKEDFFGGIRAIVTEKNILIDESFATKILEEKEKKSGGRILC